MTNRVVVTGMGIVAPGGNSPDDFAEAIFAGKSAVAEISRFNPTEFRIKVAAEVKDFDPVEFMPIAVVRKTDRFAHFGVAAAKGAIESSGLNEDNGLSNAAVIIGSGLGGSLFHEEAIVSFVESGSIRGTKASSVPRITPNAVSAYIAIQNKIKGPNRVISTACSSGTQAIGDAFRCIKKGEIDVAVAGGVEASVSLVNMAMFQAMMALGCANNGDDISTASRPFDATRNGFVMGEGGAVLTLESLEHALSRNAPIIAEVAGFGSNCGAYHMVAPNPNGEDACEAMKSAIDDAGINVDEVDHVQAHGTSTKYNDLAETQALKQLMGKRAYKVPVSAIKSMVGHTIGASGAIQAVAACLTLQRGILAPTINLNKRDPDCDLDYVANQAREVEVSTILSNSFGFGSNNACLVIKRY